MLFPIVEGVAATGRHTTSYLESGPADGTPVILVHGWPELAISWRHQIPLLAELGFRVIAPDMRGYGRSTTYDRVEAYSMEETVADLLELLAAIGKDKAIWIGHDAGAAAVWALASHHPEACIAIANLCVPYVPEGFTLSNLVELVDREVYPAGEYPYGQWAYYKYHQDEPAEVAATLEADVAHATRLVFRRGDPDELRQPSAAGKIKAPAGWKPIFEATKGLACDSEVLDEESYGAFLANFKRNGFAGPNCFYRNDRANEDYAARSVNGGRLDMPVGFVHALYDMSCNTAYSDLARPMREACASLSEYVVKAGHWVQQEKPVEVNAALTHWLATAVPGSWQIERP